MNRKKAAPGIDFADAQLVWFEMNKNGSLHVFLDSWEEKRLTILFTKPIKFLWRGGSFVKGFYEILDKTPFLEDALNKHKVIKDGSFKLFQLIDIHQIPFIEVVAESVHVFK